MLVVIVVPLNYCVQDNPKYAAEHQLAVIDCLEDPDETLKRKVGLVAEVLSVTVLVYRVAGVEVFHSCAIALCIAVALKVRVACY